MKVVSIGAEARLFESSYLGEKVLVKERLSKGYRNQELDEKLRRLRTQREASLLYRALFLVEEPERQRNPLLDQQALTARDGHAGISGEVQSSFELAFICPLTAFQDTVVLIAGGVHSLFASVVIQREV